MNTQFLYSNLGKRYKLYFDGRRPEINSTVGASIKPLAFTDHVYTKQFIRTLSAPPSLWRKLANTQITPVLSPERDQDIEHKISLLFMSGKINVYELPDAHHVASSPRSLRTIKGKGKLSYEFAPASTLLTEEPTTVKSFGSKDEVANFIDELGPETSELADLAKQLKIQAPSNQQADYTALVNLIAEEISKGNVVTIENTVNNQTQLPNQGGDQSSAASPQDTQAPSLGPHAGEGGATAAVVQQAAEEEECGVCTVKEFIATCGHGRSQSLQGKLRVVPGQTETRSIEVKLMGVKVAIKEEFGGKEKIDFSVSLDGAKRGDCPYVKGENGWEQKEKGSLEVQGTVGENLDLWPIDAAPKTYQVSGKGCTGPAGNTTIEVYPNQKYTIEGNLDLFQKWSKEVNDAWGKWGEKVFSYSPVELKPKINPPSGSFSASWGWKEDSDWKAYYDVAVSLGLNPVFGVEIEIKLSVVKLIGTMAGVPPVMSKFAAEHLADVLLGAKAGAKASLMGTPHGKKYPDGAMLVSGDAKFSAEGTVELSLTARVGSDYIFSAAMIASGQAKLAGESTLDLNRDGLFAQTAITLDPLIATVKVEYKYLVVFTRTKEKKWTPWKQMELYKSPNNKILPR